MSGLFAAAFLRQIGWEANVYERSAVELVGRGAGITMHPELLRALYSAGATTHNLGVEVERRIALDRTGRVIAEKRLPQILTSWDRLQRLLRETIDPAHYHLGWNFERVEQDGSGGRVHFSGGRVEHGDILVGGDGVRSGVRAAIQPEVQPIYAGYYMSDPANPREAGRWWIPGMNQAAGETPSWPTTSRYGLHHAIVHGDTAYAAWRDAGMVVIDVADRTRPQLVTHRNWSPPFGGGTHNCLPLPDRNLLIVLRYVCVDAAGLIYSTDYNAGLYILELGA